MVAKVQLFLEKENSEEENLKKVQIFLDNEDALYK